jgi:hypothetical protein
VPGADLIYLFWHAPPAGADRSAYEAALVAWQDALAGHPPPGYRRGWTWRVAVPPWLTGWPDVAYLDGYVVTDFTALGALNAHAPSGPLAPAHDSAARRAAHGAGALFACCAGIAGPDPGAGPDPADPDRSDPGAEPGDERPPTVHLSWHEKPAGRPYGDVIDDLSGDGRSVWLRQMVLGAGPELLVVSREGDAPRPGVWQASAERLVGLTRS